MDFHKDYESINWTNKMIYAKSNGGKAKKYDYRCCFCGDITRDAVSDRGNNMTCAKCVKKVFGDYANYFEWIMTGG